MAELQIITRKEPNEITTISLEGRIDTYSYARLEKALDNLVRQQSYKLVVDCSQLDYINSSGVGVLVRTLGAVQENNGHIVLINPKPMVKEVFDMLGLTQLFSITGDRQTAFNAFTTQTQVMVVDEDPLTSRVLGETLGKKNCAVSGFTSGKEALAHLQTNPVNLLVTDIKVSDMSGLELIRTVRKLKPQLPVIVLFEYLDPQTKNELVKLAVSGYVNEIFGFKYLEKIIEESLQKR